MTQTETPDREQLLKRLAKPVARTEVEKFSEIFDDWKPYELFGKGASSVHAFLPRYVTGQNVAGNLYKNVEVVCRGGRHNGWRHPDESMAVGPFCAFEGRNFTGNKYFSVKCADWVLESIKQRTIIIGGDTVSFRIIDHGNGWSLATGSQGRVSGGVWLAYIRTDSIPQQGESKT